jgi:hypothetical protein
LQQLYGEDTSAALQYLNQSSESLKDENASHPVQGGVTAAAKLIGALTGSTATGVDITRGCRIAAAIYDGWDDPRTIAVREWLHTEFATTAFGRFVMSAYLRFGERIAEQIKLHPPLMRVFKPIFDAALRRAEAA